MFNSNSFWTGYIFGSSGNGQGGGRGDSGGTGCLLIFGFFLLSIVGFIFTFFAQLIPSLTYKFLHLYENILVKIILFPSTFDFLFDWEDNYYTRGLILFIGFIVLAVISQSLKGTSRIFYIFLTLQSWVLFLRFIGTFIFAISLTLFGESNYFTEEKTDLKILEKMDSNQTISEAINPTRNYEYGEAKDDLLMTDVHGDGSHKKYLWINFNAPETDGSSEERSISLEVEPRSTLYYGGINASDEFTTTISYVPRDDESDWNNKSGFTIEFYVNKQQVKSVDLSSEHSVIPISIPLRDAEEFVIKVNGRLVDRSIVTFLSPTFSADF